MQSRTCCHLFSVVAPVSGIHKPHGRARVRCCQSHRPAILARRESSAPVLGREHRRGRGSPRRRGGLLRRLPDHPVLGDHGAHGPRAPQAWGDVPPGRGRDRLRVHAHRCRVGRGQAPHRDERPRIFPDAGRPGDRDHDRDPARGGGRDAPRARHRPGLQGGPGRPDAGPVGAPRGSAPRGVRPFFRPRLLRPRGPRREHRGAPPRAGGPPLRRADRPHLGGRDRSGRGGEGRAAATLGR